MIRSIQLSGSARCHPQVLDRLVPLQQALHLLGQNFPGHEDLCSVYIKPVLSMSSSWSRPFPPPTPPHPKALCSPASAVLWPRSTSWTDDIGPCSILRSCLYSLDPHCFRYLSRTAPPSSKAMPMNQLPTMGPAIANHGCRNARTLRADVTMTHRPNNMPALTTPGSPKIG